MYCLFSRLVGEMSSSRRILKRKRSQSQREEHPPRIAGDPTYTSVVFASEQQKVRFTKLKNRSIESTRFINKDTLTKLGILQETEQLFCNLGLKSFFEMHYDTHPALTCEFLSSLIEI